MKSHLITISLLALLFNGLVFAHEGKPEYHLIIDTDGAHDDMRAITMLLAGKEMRTLAITCSQGTLSPEAGYMKVKSLLSALYHEGIPVGVGENLDMKLPEWSAFAQEIDWGGGATPAEFGDPEDAVSLLNRTTNTYTYKLTLIALGSLKTYADWISKNPALTDRIERIIWYNSDMKEGYNYSLSSRSFNYIKKSGIRLDIVSAGTDPLLVNSAYKDLILKSESGYAHQITDVLNQGIVAKKIEEKHLKLWDDLIPIYLELPIIFHSHKDGNLNYISLIKGIPETTVLEQVHQILESSSEPNNRVFTAFPIQAELYSEDYAAILDETIGKFGYVEWKAIALTNEIHGHTGIYSIIGAKMGIRAMEYFNVGINNLRVVTYAGNKPPLSCLNDGIQISTGATIGQGLISIADSIIPIPTASFEFNGNRITMSVKPEIAAQMKADIKLGIDTHGLLSEAYWEYVEELAIRYWSTYDRHEMFVIGVE